MKRNTRVLQPSQPKSPLPYKRYARRQTTARTWTFVKNWDDSKKDFPAKISPTAQVLVKADPKLSVRKKKDVKDLNSSSDGSSISDIFNEESSDAFRKPSLNLKKPDIPQESDQETTETEHVLRSSSKKGIPKKEKEIETSTLKENLLTPRSLKSKKDIDSNTSVKSPRKDNSLASKSLKSNLNTTEISPRKDNSLASKSLKSNLNTTEVSPRKDNSLASRRLRSKNNTDHLSTTEVSPQKDKSLRSKNIDLGLSDGGSENSPKKISSNLTVNKSVSGTPNKITSDVENSDVVASRTLRSSKKPSEASKSEIETLAKQKTENHNANNKSIRKFHDSKTIEKEIVSDADTICDSTDSDVVKQRLANTDSVEDSTDSDVVKRPPANTDDVDNSTDLGVVKRSRKKSGTFDIPVMVSSDKSPDPDQKTPEKVVLLHPETHRFRKSSEKKKREKGHEKETTYPKDGHGPQSHGDKKNINNHPEEPLTSDLNRDTEDSEMASVENDEVNDDADFNGYDDVNVPVGQRSSSLFSSSLKSNKDSVGAPAGQRSSSVFSYSLRSNTDSVDKELKLASDEDKMDEVDGVRDDDEDDDVDDDDVNDGLEMSKEKQKSHQQKDETKINSMDEDDESDDVVMSNDEKIANKKSSLSSPLGKRKRSLQVKNQNNEKEEETILNVSKKGKVSNDEQISDEKSSASSILGKRKKSLPDKDQNDVEDMKVRNVSKKGKMAVMKKLTSSEATDDRPEHNICKTINDHTVDKSINVVEHYVSQTSNGHQQKSPQQNKLAVRFKPDKKKTDHGPGQSLPIWCGGLHQRHKKDILDLDVVLDHVSNHLEEERNNCDTNAERKAVKKMMLYMTKEITDTIDKVESLKTMSISVKHSKKNIKELRQQLLKTEEDKSRLMNQITEKKKQFNENLHRVNTWITGFEKLVHLSKKSTKIPKNQKLLTYGCFPV